MKYTPDELDNHAISDLLKDAECAEKQAKEGPFYPNITPESLWNYAKECREIVSRYIQGGAHDFLMKGSK